MSAGQSIAGGRATGTSGSPKAGVAGAVATRWERWKPHITRFGPGILINHLVTLAVIFSIAAIVGVGPGFKYVPAVIGSLWMQVNLAPLEMNGVTLGLAPMLPAVAVVWWHARRITKALGNSVSVRGLRVVASLNVGLACLMTLIAWLMLWDASRVFDISAPNILVALVSTALVNGASVVIGMRARVWRALLLRKGWGTWPVDAFGLASRFMVCMVCAGAVVACVYAAVNFQAVQQSFEITSDTSGVVGLSALSVLYVPNIAVGAAAVLLGGEFHIGSGMFSVFQATNVNVPPSPLSAAIPNGPVPYAAGALVVPAVVAVWVTYRFVRGRDFVEAPVWTAVASAPAAAFIAFCVAWLSGGELGVYGHTGASSWLCAVLAAAWLGVPALALMLWVRYAGRAVREDQPDAAVDESTAEPTSASDDGAAVDGVDVDDVDGDADGADAEAADTGDASKADADPGADDVADEAESDAEDADADGADAEATDADEDRDGADAEDADADGAEGGDADNRDRDTTNTDN